MICWAASTVVILLLLHVPNGERNFKLTYRPPFLSVEAKIADLSFSAKWYFLCKFWKIRKKFRKKYRGLIFLTCELRSETFFEKKFSKVWKNLPCELRPEEALRGFKAIMKERNHGEPCTPENLLAAGYDGDEHFIRETTVIFQNCYHPRYHFDFTRWKFLAPHCSLKSRSTERPRSPMPNFNSDSLSTISNSLRDGAGGWRSQPDFCPQYRQDVTAMRNIFVLLTRFLERE